eukprot:10153087-Karenia_brevis.AAC.1
MPPSSLNCRRNLYRMETQSPKTRKGLIAVKHFGRFLGEHAQQKPYGRTGHWHSLIHWWTRSPWRGKEFENIMKGEKFWTRP